MLGIEIDRPLTLKANATIPNRTLHTAPHCTGVFVAVAIDRAALTERKRGIFQQKYVIIATLWLPANVLHTKHHNGDPL
jgi:hypothetical protein